MKIKFWIIFFIVALFITSPVSASVTWARHTVIVSQSILDALDPVLTSSPPKTGISYYAVTNVSIVAGIYMVSIAALDSTADPEDWNMSSAVWLGNAAVSGDYLIAAIEGSTAYENLTSGTVFDGGGGFIDQPVFPWSPGFKAYYGTRGVHAAGYGLADSDWFAVDFVGGPSYGGMYFTNSVYGAIDSEITYICRDSTSVAVRAGDFLYAHLADNAFLDYGNNIRKNVQFASLVTGSFSDSCGWAEQYDDNYHLHFGMYAPTGKKNLEGWIIDRDSQLWINGAGKVEIGGTLWSTGINNSGVDDNGDPLVYLNGEHFWDAPINSIINLTTTQVVSRLPQPIDWDMVGILYNAAGVVIRIFYIFLKYNFNLGLFIIILSVMLILEPIRLTFSLIRSLKKIIPFA